VLEFLFPNLTCLVCKTEINGGGYICGVCEKTLPRCDDIAPFFYKDPIVGLIMRFKYNAEGDIAKLFAPYMIEMINDDIDFLVPVPLSGERMKERGYNQALLIAKQLNKLIADVLIRTRKTIPQKNMSIKKRQENLKGAFKIIKNHGIIGKNILLVDDVYTTGATVMECKHVLMKNGANRVDIITMAKVEQ